jgi:SAM-dependent methyltransferase
MQDTDWDAAYQKNELPWDKGAASPPLLEFLETDGITGRVLVPGCGLGHDVRGLAARGAEVVGLDISPTAVARAQEMKKTAEERFVCANLFDLPPELRGSFDWVVEHTCLSGLPPAMRADYIAALHLALKSGGTYLAVFFVNPWDEAETPTPPPYGISVDEVDAMIAGRFEVEREWRPTRHFPGREGRELMRLMRRI